MTAALSMMGLCKQRGAILTNQVDGTLEEFGGVMTWNDSDFEIVNGNETTSYRNIIASGTINVNNNLQRRGTRPNYGAGSLFPSGAPELSRCPYAIVPGVEKTDVSIVTHDKLPDSVLYSRFPGTLRFTAKGYSSVGLNGGIGTLTIEIPLSRISSDAFQGGQPSSPFSWNYSFYAIGCNVSYTYA